MTENVEFIERVVRLEEQVKRLETTALDAQNQAGKALIRMEDIKAVKVALPKTDILSHKFLKRAFAIWGHYFVAQIIIVVTFYVLIFCLVALFSSTL